MRSPEPAPSSGPPPRTLGNGRYLVSRKLAEGGTAVVHLGFDTVDEQWRAIKTLLPEYSRRPALRHRFEVEAKTMSGLVHPNIIRVYEAGQEGEVAWLAMELAEGGSVVDWIEKHGRMPPRLACQVTLDVCAGIGFAHGMGVIHRDIKPQNVLVSGDGTCKVTDFGIAQVVQETRMTMTGTVMGTIGYMAPEQHESAKHADARADIYSVAATLYTLLVGEAPTHLFMAEDDDFAAIPQALIEIIRKGSQYRREARYESMEAFADALRAVLEKLPDDPPTAPLARPGDLDLARSDLDPPTGDTVRALALRASEARDPSHDLPVVTVPPPVVRVRSQSEEAVNEAVSLPSGLSRASFERHRSASQTPATPRTPFVRTTRDPGSENLRRALVGGAGVAGLLAVVLAIVVALGAVRINTWEQLATHQESLLYGQIHEERAIIDYLPADQVPELEEIHRLFDQAENGTPEEREEAANRLVTTLDSTRRQVEERGNPNQQHVVKQLRESVKRIQNKLSETRAAEEKVEQVRSEFLGRIAGWFGF